MALVGGGGAGNIAGSNPVGTGSTLNYIGEHALGYSGQINLDSSEKTLLAFDTNNSLFVGTFQMLYDWTGFSAGEDLGFTIKFNGEIVGRVSVAASTSAIDSVMREVAIIIPPYTAVEILGDTDAGSIYVTGSLVGRVYYA